MITKEKITPNERQRECIKNIEGRYLILAGPGTGKTFTIVERIKYMLQNGVLPEKILCLTFTEAASLEMRKRLERELDKLSVDINIFTYHAFSCNIIDKYPEIFELPQNYKVITEGASFALIRECIQELNPKALRTDKNDPYFYIGKIKNSISQIKQNRIDKEQFFYNLENNFDWLPALYALRRKVEEKKAKGDLRLTQNLRDIKTLEKSISQMREIWDFYELYQKKMELGRYLDFNDMINIVLNKFDENPGFLERVANDYEYILVDEYQDTNKAQNNIIFALSHALRTKNVFTVGDDDQIIYSFQGAKLDTIEKFLEEFPDTKVICLNENMRSTQDILDFARELSFQDPKRLEGNPKFEKYNISKKLTSKNQLLVEKNNPVQLRKYADITQEQNEIVKEIEELINSPDCPKNENGQKTLSQIAILTRYNADLKPYTELLKAKNIPYELKEGRNIFEIPSVNILYFYIQMLCDVEKYSHRFFEFLLSKPFLINPKDYSLIAEHISSEKTFIEVVKNIPSEKFQEPEKIKKFIETYDYLRIYKTKESLRSVILEIGAKTGIFDFYLNDEINRIENIAGLKRFLDEAQGFSEIYQTSFLEEFLDYLEIMKNDENEIKTDKAPIAMNAIQLLTYHSSKGREFEYVYMPFLTTEKWESSKGEKPIIPLNPSEYKDKDELKEDKYSDRIKLLYVGMTRAKHTLKLSYPELVNGKEKKLTCFISNLKEKLVQDKNDFSYTQESFWEEAKKVLFKREYDYKKEFSEFVNSKIENLAFSPSGINSYLKCPRQYFYERILGFKGKDGNPDSASYGTALHFALEFAANEGINKGEYPKISDVILKFKEKCRELSFSSYEQAQILAVRGENALEKFYPIFCNTPLTYLYKTEEKIIFELQNATFKGIIDRIDKNEDGTFTIYDYKSGNAKSGLALGGEHEDYYNQIGLYKYFFEKASGSKVSKTIFIYPEDFDKNCELKLTEEECEDIVAKFEGAISDIRACKFEPSYDENACKYCAYKDFCQMNII